MTNKSELDEVKAELAAIKRQLTPTPYPDDAAVAAHRDKLHQASEARASAFNPFTRSQMAAFRDAAPGGIWRDHRGAPTGPTGAGTSGQLGKVSSNVGLPGSNTGWATEIPISNPPGIRYVDAQLDAQDRKDKADLIRAEAIRRAAAKGG